MAKTKTHGTLFEDKPSFETDAPANKYDLDYKGKHIARIYHKIKTDRPSGVYIEPNYKNKQQGLEFLRRLMNKDLAKDSYIWSTDVKHSTSLDKGIEAFKKIQKKAADVSQSRPKVTLLKDNRTYSDNNPLANKFYKDIKDYIERKGYRVEIDADRQTAIADRGSQIWMGFHRGSNRLRYSSPGTRVYDMSNSNRSKSGLVDQSFTITPDLFRKIDQALQKRGAARKKYPSYPTDLKAYQRRTLQRMTDPRTTGLVVAHGTGTGKTRQAIEATKALNMPTHVVVPAALQENYRKELKKWVGEVPKNINITSQQRIARQGLKSSPNDLLVVDEAHRARENQSSLYNALRRSPAKKRMFLTATPIFNHPKDMATLVNMAANKNLLPTNKGDFDHKFVNYKTKKPGLIQRLGGVKPGLVPELKNKRQLGKILNQYVDYYPGSTEGFPSSTEEVVKVPLGERQQEIYKAIMGQAPWWIRQKVKYGLPPGKGELETMRAFLSGVRQVSNTNRGFVKSPRNYEEVKIRKAFDFLNNQIKNDPNYKAVIYSNYLQSGLAPYKDYLAKNQIPFGEFSGDITSKVRDDLVKQYNANKLKALLISSAGAEGLDLKGTRLIQILEPHFNEEKEKQIIGRGIRYGSHANLPPEAQHVLVQRYLAQPRAGLMDKLLGRKTIQGADEYIRNLALQKSLLTNEMTKLLAEQNKNLPTE